MDQPTTVLAALQGISLNFGTLSTADALSGVDPATNPERQKALDDFVDNNPIQVAQDKLNALIAMWGGSDKS